MSKKFDIDQILMEIDPDLEIFTAPPKAYFYLNDKRYVHQSITNDGPRLEGEEYPKKANSFRFAQEAYIEYMTNLVITLKPKSLFWRMRPEFVEFDEYVAVISRFVIADESGQIEVKK